MATPTPTTRNTQSGHRGTTIWWSGAWPSTPTEFSGEIVVNLSALGESYTNALRVERIFAQASAGIGFTLHYDHTTDLIICVQPPGMTVPVEYDFRSGREGGLVDGGSGDTGDIILDSISAAQDDHLFLIIDWYAN